MPENLGVPADSFCFLNRHMYIATRPDKKRHLFFVHPATRVLPFRIYRLPMNHYRTVIFVCYMPLPIFIAFFMRCHFFPLIVFAY